GSHFSRPGLLPSTRQLGRATQLLQSLLEAAPCLRLSGAGLCAGSAPSPGCSARPVRRDGAKGDDALKASAKLPWGTAMVELVLTLPIFVMALFFGLYLNDLIHAKLKIQEASRYAAFEMTSYALTDYASGRHDEAFARAASKTREDVATRYASLDSANADRIAGSQ